MGALQVQSLRSMVAVVVEVFRFMFPGFALISLKFQGLWAGFRALGSGVSCQ